MKLLLSLLLLQLLLLPLLLDEAGASSHYSAEEYPHHVRSRSDYYGDYLEDGHGLKIYVHCFDPRYSVHHNCRIPAEEPLIYTLYPRPRTRHNHNHRHHYGHTHYHVHGYNDVYHGPESYPSDPGYYGYHDGRDNINVGKAHFYRQGRTMIIECAFPRNNWVLSNIVWYRKSSTNNRRYDRYFTPQGKTEKRITVESYGSNGSRLVIRNFSFYEDGGLYRCFATRYSRSTNHYDRSSTSPTENIYMEVTI